MNIKNILKFLFLFGVLFFIPFINFSCDGSFYVQGAIYEWINPPMGEMGDIYITPDEPPNGLELSPISAQLMFYDKAGEQNLGCSRPSSEFIQNKNLTTISNAVDGSFKISYVVSPGKYPMKVVVNKTGYYTIDKEFNFNTTNYNDLTFTIVIVRKS